MGVALPAPMPPGHLMILVRKKQVPMDDSPPKNENKCATSREFEVRMLTPSEVESLRRDKQEAGAWLMDQMRQEQPLELKSGTRN